MPEMTERTLQRGVVTSLDPAVGGCSPRLRGSADRRRIRIGSRLTRSRILWHGRGGETSDPARVSAVSQRVDTLRVLLTRTAVAMGAAVILSGAGVTEARADALAPGAPKRAERPAINWIYAAHEDWSVLADPALRTDPFDRIKYIPIGADPMIYLSLGVTVRERFESVSLRLTPLEPDDYLLTRTRVHAHLHLGTHLRLFTQLIDSRASGKTLVRPIDQNRLDLGQAFVAVTIPVGPGDLGITVGRQDPELDLQRFVASREGPNVPQPFDSFHADYTSGAWWGVAFYSRPVLTHDEDPFDDHSSHHFTITGAHVERRHVAAGKLSLFAAQLSDDDGRNLTGFGRRERRNVVDLRYVGRAAGWDWDTEGMAQGGDLGGKKVRAWGAGGLFGYTWASEPWSPRLGLQFDAASGNNEPSGNTLRTFNPLFPNGFYELLAGYPGYANFVHLKSSAMVHPMRTVSALFTGGALWRKTTADAVYLLPAIPVFGTAGRGSAYSGVYAQIRLDWAISPHLAGAIDAEQFAHSRSLHQTGARDGHYVGIELKAGI